MFRRDIKYSFFFILILASIFLLTSVFLLNVSQDPRQQAAVSNPYQVNPPAQTCSLYSSWCDPVTSTAYNCYPANFINSVRCSAGCNANRTGCASTNTGVGGVPVVPATIAIVKDCGNVKNGQALCNTLREEKRCVNGVTQFNNCTNGCDPKTGACRSGAATPSPTPTPAVNTVAPQSTSFRSCGSSLQHLEFRCKNQSALEKCVDGGLQEVLCANGCDQQINKCKVSAPLAVTAVRPASAPLTSVADLASTAPSNNQTNASLRDRFVAGLNQMGIGQPQPTAIPTPAQIQLSGVCEGEISSVRGCLNTSQMLFNCQDGSTDTQACAVAGSCRGTKCNGEDLAVVQFAPVPEPSPALSLNTLLQPVTDFISNIPIVGQIFDPGLEVASVNPEQVYGASQGRCLCTDTTGKHLVSTQSTYQCDDQSLCCENASFDKNFVGMNVCVEDYDNEERLFNPDLRLQTDIDLQALDTNYDDGGCGVVALCTTHTLLQGGDCDIAQIQEYLQAKGTFRPTTFTNADGSSYVAVSTSGKAIAAYLADNGYETEVIYAGRMTTLNDLNPQDQNILADATQNGNVLLVAGQIESAKGDIIPHWFVFDDCSEGVCRGYDSYFDQYLTVNYSGNAYHIDYLLVGDRVSFDNITAVHLKEAGI